MHLDPKRWVPWVSSWQKHPRPSRRLSRTFLPISETIIITVMWIMGIMVERERENLGMLPCPRLLLALLWYLLRSVTEINISKTINIKVNIKTAVTYNRNLNPKLITHSPTRSTTSTMRLSSPMMHQQQHQQHAMIVLRWNRNPLHQVPIIWMQIRIQPWDWDCRHPFQRLRAFSHRPSFYLRGSRNHRLLAVVLVHHRWKKLVSWHPHPRLHPQHRLMHRLLHHPYQLMPWI